MGDQGECREVWYSALQEEKGEEKWKGIQSE